MTIRRYINGKEAKSIEKTVVENEAVRAAMRAVNRRIKEEREKKA